MSLQIALCGMLDLYCCNPMAPTGPDGDDRAIRFLSLTRMLGEEGCEAKTH